MNKEEVKFNPKSFCHLKDTLKDLSELEIGKNQLKWFPFDEYIDQLSKLEDFLVKIDLLEEELDYSKEIEQSKLKVAEKNSNDIKDSAIRW